MRTERRRCRPNCGCAISIWLIASRIRPVTALRARSAGSRARRARPPRPTAAPSSAKAGTLVPGGHDWPVPGRCRPRLHVFHPRDRTDGRGTVPNGDHAPRLADDLYAHKVRRGNCCSRRRDEPPRVYKGRHRDGGDHATTAGSTCICTPPWSPNLWLRVRRQLCPTTGDTADC